MTALRVTFAALVAMLALDASAWWETQVVTNKWEYDGVEYLQSSGTQWINTGIYNSFASSIEYSAVFEGAAVSQWPNSEMCIFGNKNSGGQGTTVFANKSSFSTWSGSGTSWVVGSYSATKTYYSVLFYLSTGRSAVLNGVASASSTIANNAFNPTIPIALLNDKVDSAVTPFFGKVYQASITKDNALSIHLVPVLHEGEGKMLDLVHNTLYANAGTGAFTYGSVTGTVTCTVISTNRVYHANPPQTAYDAANPWNAAERTRLALDSAPVTNWVSTLYGSNAVIRESFRPSAYIKKED